MKKFASIVFLMIAWLASAQVIGIDFGTEFWKASLISPGKNLVIVENTRSGRKSHNGIAFVDGVRHFEYDAFQKLLKKPQASYFYLNKLIESLEHQQPLQSHKFENGTYYFQQSQELISLEQMVGMILKNIKKYSSQQANSDIKDAVLTVPAHWGFKSKMSLINAAAIADLNILGIINQNAAAAIHFAITRNDSQPINIGFFNMGSHNLQVSFVQFFGTYDTSRQKNIQSMKVLSHLSIPNFGGLEFDHLLAEHVAAEFKSKHKIDVHQNLKSWTKLVKKCADLKQTLSANKEANIYIEGLINGIDLNLPVKRQVLQRSPIFQKLPTYLEKALNQAGISKNDLNSVEVIGGGSRVPLIGKILRQFFNPVEVGSHINGDESMAFGAALRAANLSIAFRVKQLHFYDGNPQPVKAVITNIEDGVISETELYDKNSEQGLKREVILDENEQDIKVSIFYGEQVVQEYIVSNVSHWKEKFDSTSLNFTEQPKLILVFSAHSYNFAELKQAYMNITLNTSTTKEVYETIKQNVTVQVEVKDQQQEVIQKEPSQKQNTQIDREQQAYQHSKQTTKQNQQNKAEKMRTKMKTKEQERTVKKTIDDFRIDNKKILAKISLQYSKYPRFCKEKLEQLKKIVTKYEMHENYLNEKSKIRNDFESTLYALKEDFDNPGLKHFSTEEELERLKYSVTQQIAWLDNNAWTAEKDEFEKHFKNVQDIYVPIVNRSNESRDREKFYNKSIQILSLVYSKTTQLNSSQPWVQQKAEAHLKKINQTVEHIYSKVKEQFQRKPNQDVKYYNHQMIQTAQRLRDQYYHIKMTPRPRVTKKNQSDESESQKRQKVEENIDLDSEKKTNQEQLDIQSGEYQKRKQNNRESSKQTEDEKSTEDL